MGVPPKDPFIVIFPYKPTILAFPPIDGNPYMTAYCMSQSIVHPRQMMRLLGHALDVGVACERPKRMASVGVIQWYLKCFIWM